MTSMVLSILIVSVIVYLVVGFKTLSSYFWCLGTSHGGYKSNATRNYEIIAAAGLILAWPLFYIWLIGVGVVGYVTVKLNKRKKQKHNPVYTCEGKGGSYNCFGIAQGAGKSKGQRVVIYADTETKQLYFRTEDDFEERMKLISK